MIFLLVTLHWSLNLWDTGGLLSITPKCFGLNDGTVMGEQHRRARVSRNFRSWLCHPRSRVLNHSLEGKAECTQSFYILALNRSRKVHLLKCKPKCKWYFLVLTTLSPSDLEITDSETLHQLVYWWLTKSQTSAWKTLCKLLHSHFTTLIVVITTLHRKIWVIKLCSYHP